MRTFATTIATTIAATALLLATCIGGAQAAQAAPCRWDNPGANRSLVDAAAAIMAMADIPASERITLADMAGARGVRHSWRQVTVTRDDIDNGRYIEMRDMNFGATGRVCLGPVDRSRWPASHIERGLVYQVGPYAVIVFSACGNVARITDQQQPAPTGPPQRRPRTVLGRLLAGEPWSTDHPSTGTAGMSLMLLGSGGATAVPEPGTWALLVAAAAAAAAATARARHHHTRRPHVPQEH